MSAQQAKIVVHDGKFHADDLFAAATLRLLLKGDCTILRTRDPKEIEFADYVIDVGGVNDPGQKRFDHHQHGGAGTRDNGIPYAAFGLVWRKYGDDIAGSAKVAARVDARLVAPIDADDNGYSLVQSIHSTAPYSLQSMLYALRPTWKEDVSAYDTAFMELLPFVEKIIMREVTQAAAGLEAAEMVETAYKNALDKRCIEIDKNYPFKETLGAHTEPLYVISPRPADGFWKVECVPKGAYGFENRKSFPEAWAGLRDADLVKVTGVQDAVFCHNGRFLCVAKTKEGAWALAKAALIA